MASKMLKSSNTARRKGEPQNSPKPHDQPDIRQSKKTQRRVGNKRDSAARSSHPLRPAEKIQRRGLKVSLSANRVSALPTVESQRDREPSFEITPPGLFLFWGYLTGVTLLMFAVFDLLLGIPFYNASQMFDFGLLFSAAILLYMSWDTSTERRQQFIK